VGEPSVFVVILNWNGLADTILCLDSLGDLSYPRERLRVVVVDNGSHDGSPGVLRSRYPAITVIENHRNLGYTGGVNVGLRFAVSGGADYVWLLNNDTTVESESLSRLVHAGEAQPGIGLLSPGVYDSESGALHWAGTVLDVPRRVFVDVVDAEDRRVGVADGPMLLWGTGMLIKRAAAEAVGYFDDRYFAYVEYLDYSLRAIKKGMETRVIRDARIFHRGSRSLGPMSLLRHYLLVRNRYLFWSSHLGAEWTWREAGRRLADIVGAAAESRRGGRNEIGRASLDAAWDAWRGRFGDVAKRGRMPWLVRALLTWRPYLWIRLLDGKRWRGNS
jgi:GT2 family glycosyltransferase